MKIALIIHGTEGYPEENWFPWLKNELAIFGYQTIIPQFPTPQGQNPEEWLKVLAPLMNNFNEESILIGHSIGATFLLRVLEKLETKVKAAVLVAPSFGIKPITYFDLDVPFTKDPFDWNKIRSSASHFLVFHSEDDPYICLANGQKIADELGTTLIAEKNAGHFNANAGYAKFPDLLEKLKKFL
jgi:predicted alpha/beta hydrolase family esterase